MPESGAVIRRATSADAHAIAACLGAAFEPYRAEYTPGAFTDTVLTADGAVRRLTEMILLVAEHGGAIVGTIGYQAAGNGEGHLRGMAVLPSAQRAGIAARLLSSAEAGLRDAGCVRVTLDTTKPLTRAIAFYEHRGYVPTGRVADFYGMSLYEYEKRLEAQP